MSITSLSESFSGSEPEPEEFDDRDKMEEENEPSQVCGVTLLNHSLTGSPFGENPEAGSLSSTGLERYSAILLEILTPASFNSLHASPVRVMCQ